MTSSTTPSSSWPVGFGFHPTDEELVNHFLKLKMWGGNDQQLSDIAEVNVYDFEAWQLPGLSAIQSDDLECYFFSRRSRRYPNSDRTKRTTEAGYWKVTGQDRTFKTKRTGEHIATKTTLVYYNGRGRNAVKTNWVMHEYKPAFSFNNQRDFVLYKLKKDPDYLPAFEAGEPICSSNAACDYSTPQTVTEEDSYQLGAELYPFHGYDERDYNLNAAFQFQ